jgi:hypothetical protein
MRSVLLIEVEYTRKSTPTKLHIKKANNDVQVFTLILLHCKLSLIDGLPCPMSLLNPKRDGQARAHLIAVAGSRR